MTSQIIAWTITRRPQRTLPHSKEIYFDGTRIASMARKKKSVEGKTGADAGQILSGGIRLGDWASAHAGAVA